MSFLTLLLSCATPEQPEPVPQLPPAQTLSLSSPDVSLKTANKIDYKEAALNMVTLGDDYDSGSSYDYKKASLHTTNLGAAMTNQLQLRETTVEQLQSPHNTTAKLTFGILDPDLHSKSHFTEGAFFLEEFAMPNLGGFWTQRNRLAKVEGVTVGDHELLEVVHNEITLPVLWRSAAAYFVKVGQDSGCNIMVKTESGELFNEQDGKARISSDCPSMTSEDAMTLVGQFNDALTQPQVQ